MTAENKWKWYYQYLIESSNDNDSNVYQYLLCEILMIIY
jgi:hypothetical protein